MKSKKDLENTVSKSIKELNRKKEELEKINNVVNAINSKINFIDLLKTILDELKIIEGVEKSSALIFDNKSDQFKFIASTGWDESKLNSINLGLIEIEEIYLKISSEIDKNIFIAHTINSSPLSQKIYGDELPKSLLTLQIIIDNRNEGFLVFENFQLENAFKNYDENSATFVKDDMRCKHGVELLSNLREHIISAFQKAKLLEDYQTLNDNKNLFMSITAHDLLTPLTIINSFVKILHKNSLEVHIDRQQLTNHLEEIITASERMKRLLADLMDISAIDSGKLKLYKQEISSYMLLSSCVDFHKTLAKEKNINLTYDLDEDLPSIIIDKERISEVLDNLLSNAIKFTFPGGNIKVFAERNSSSIIVHIKDNGQGLTEDDLKNVFKSYKKLSAVPTAGESSTGLGLMIVKRIIELHNGSVWVESTKGSGSIFSFKLPIS